VQSTHALDWFSRYSREREREREYTEHRPGERRERERECTAAAATDGFARVLSMPPIDAGRNELRQMTITITIEVLTEKEAVCSNVVPGQA
jgi:hypothetical protein